MRRRVGLLALPFVVLVVAVAACAAPPRPVPSAATSVTATLRYTVKFADRVAGSAEIAIARDGTRASHVAFNDRGRGPDLETTLVLSPDGLPREVTTTGVNYLKAKVREEVHWGRGALSWRGTSERGASVDRHAFFLPALGPVDSLAVLARALRARPGGRLRLLPGGEAWIEGEVAVDVELDGRARRITGVAIGGLGFAPVLTWLDDDGELFAEVSSWQTLIRTGAEALAPRLLAEQARWLAARAEAVARRVTRPLPRALAITHTRLFDPEARAMREDVTIVIAAGMVTAVGPAATTPVPAGAEVIDGRGKSVLPGLWDMHAHILDDDGLLDLAAGVTSARDLGNDIEDLAARMARFDAGTEVGPRLLRAGLIDGPGPFTAPTGPTVEDAAQARAAVARYADLGFQQIKIYSSVAPALVPVMAEAAHARKLRVSGHVPQGMTAQQAVEAGFDELQHANFLFLNFLATAAHDTRGPHRLTVVAEGAGGLDLASPQVTAFIDVLRSRGTVVDPTLNVFEMLFTGRPDAVMPGLAMVADRLPPQVRRGYLDRGLPVAGAEDARNRAAFAAMQRFILLLWQRGVPVVAGTDGLAGFALHRELELYVEAGIPVVEVLRLATLGAAQVAGKDGELGVVAVGRPADLIIVDGDPVAKIGDLRRVETIVTRGRRYQAAELLAAAGIAPVGAR